MYLLLCSSLPFTCSYLVFCWTAITDPLSVLECALLHVPKRAELFGRTYLFERTHNFSSRSSNAQLQKLETQGEGRIDDKCESERVRLGRTGVEGKDKWSNGTMCFLLWNVWRSKVLTARESFLHPLVRTFYELPSNPPTSLTDKRCFGVILYIRAWNDPVIWMKHTFLHLFI